MDYKSDISGELREISPLVAGLPRKAPYSAPEEGYWDELPGVVMTQIHLQAVRHHPVFDVPEDYFDSFPARMMDRLEAYGPPMPAEIHAELEELSPLLSTISRKPVYEVPPGYFETFSVELPAKQKARVVSLPRRTQQWFGYVAAALVAGIMVTAAFIFTDNNEMQSYNGIENINVSEGVSRLSEEEIANYLNAHPSSGDMAITTGNNELSEPEMQNAMDNLSEEEIQQYLQENSEPGEVVPRGI